MAPAADTAGTKSDFSAKRLLIEFCCSEDSALGQNGPNTGGCEMMRLTEKDDMTKSENVDKVLKAVNKYGSSNITLWASIPGTGGIRVAIL